VTESLVELVLRNADRSHEFLALRAAAFEAVPRAAFFEGPEVEVELVAGGLTARAIIPDYYSDVVDLSKFLAEIDRDWRGWSGVKTAGNADFGLGLQAEHDGRGHVTMEVVVSDPYGLGRSWSARALLRLDIGSFGRLARDGAAWTSAVWAPE
jgi:hypothetical protein